MGSKFTNYSSPKMEVSLSIPSRSSANFDTVVHFGTPLFYLEASIALSNYVALIEATVMVT